MHERRFDLQNRLIDYAVRIIKLTEALPKTKAGNHISVQLLKSGTSAAANYGEAQSAESRADFVHKLKVSLKEMRETYIWIRVIFRGQLIEPESLLLPLLQETNELMAILFTSIETANKNQDHQ